MIELRANGVGAFDFIGRDYQREWGRWDVTPGRTVGVELTPAVVSRLAPEALDFDLSTIYGVFDPKLQWLVLELLEESLRGALGGALYVEGLSSALIARLASCYGHRKTADRPVGSLSAIGRRRIAEFIEAHLGDELSVVALAKEAGLSPHHFSRCFTASFGQPPHRYVQQRRVEAARRMLVLSSRSLAEIAMDLGFSSQSHFSQVFRQHTGMTPTLARSVRIG
ncbi:helix-turn-helix domain-containing protein [Propionivibrio limicola]|uniref:helix-turn-helix domain-containing protein n=1 Tax=Propionivibrio limicola TaxID=167645 RepID=UPI001478E99C|nr:AraC family transcriptional regulator [Propionivibrio limicola]